MQKGAYYIMVMNMTVMVRPWDVEDAMELHSLSMHPYYLKKRVWKFLYPDTFLNAVSTIHFISMQIRSGIYFVRWSWTAVFAAFWNVKKRPAAVRSCPIGWVYITGIRESCSRRFVLCARRPLIRCRCSPFMHWLKNATPLPCMCWRQMDFKERNSESCTCLKSISRTCVLYSFTGCV